VIHEDFVQFRHEAVHELMDLNKKCENGFRISAWPRWDYDLETGTLIFSENDVPKVIASIQVVGSSSSASHTWLWGWANSSIPPHVCNRLSQVRSFGKTEGLTILTTDSTADNEYLGWEMAAITARVIGARGAYRCPSENGFLYFVYIDLRFAK
jgi:hypothetical protein